MIKKILVAPLGVFYVGTAERKRSGFGMVEWESGMTYISSWA